MKLQRFALALAGVGMLAATAAAVPATAAVRSDPTPAIASPAKGNLKTTPTTKLASGGCLQDVGFNTPTPGINDVLITPAKPPRGEFYGEFRYVGTRLNTTWYGVQTDAHFYYHSLFVQNGTLYRGVTYFDTANARPTYARIGSGWTSFTQLVTSNYAITAPNRSYLYGLSTNGSLYRYAASGATFRALGHFPGFQGFKAMTVISETPTYDTLLMTTKAGALWTVRIPAAASTKPILKLVRSTGFAAYESLAARECGERGGTLVTGFDNDTDSAYQYAMSKFNGSATAVTSYGRVTGGTIPGTGIFSITGHWNQLVGE
ncbi:hypothetical protein [Kribbella sp. NPDC004875]|uniref:hypothetical protein n=1 Tax=Kribbella sp. NPDC004875 TaxID=3364107 RepID=UPI003692BD16